MDEEHRDGKQGARTLHLRLDGQETTVELEDGRTIPAAALQSLDGDLRVYDPGLRTTAAAASAISRVDGARGELLYRGYAVEDLAAHATFSEVSYLLVRGELPDAGALAGWARQVASHSALHVKMTEFMRAFNYDAHPMGMFVASIAALSTFHPEANPALRGADMYIGAGPEACAARARAVFRILGKAPTIAANAWRHRIGRPFNAPSMVVGRADGRDYAASFLQMLDAHGAGYEPHPVLVAALDRLFILHAEHEMNCSTTALRVVASSMADPFSAVAAAAAALSGPTHGGACEAVVRMLADIGAPENVPAFLERVKRRETRLMGFGHRVYRSYDPRARAVRAIAKDVFAVCGSEPLMAVARALEAAALADAYFVDRQLFPNIDFYSGLIYSAMGFPPDFFPLLFAIPRVAGWLAHWVEAHEAAPDGQAALPIWRPMQAYVGRPRRAFVPLAARSAVALSAVPAALSVADTHPYYRRHVLGLAATAQREADASEDLPQTRSH